MEFYVEKLGEQEPRYPAILRTLGLVQLIQQITI